jgi:hypothetical protein
MKLGLALVLALFASACGGAEFTSEADLEGYCGAAFLCGGNQAAAPPQLCAHDTATNSSRVIWPTGATCAHNTCAFVQTVWTSDQDGCVLLSCDDSNGQVRVTCR